MGRSWAPYLANAALCSLVFAIHGDARESGQLIYGRPSPQFPLEVLQDSIASFQSQLDSGAIRPGPQAPAPLDEVRTSASATASRDQATLSGKPRQPTHR